MVRCALLPDYYVRTGAETLKDVPQIKAEMTRIWADFDFVCSGPTWEQVPERMEGYKKRSVSILLLRDIRVVSLFFCIKTAEHPLGHSAVLL